MSILDNLPHVSTAKIRTISQTTGLGNKPSYAVVFSDRECWRQEASDKEVREFEKRGIRATDKIYFTSDPEIDERHILTDVRDSGATAGTGTTWEVVSRAEPDASAGLGVVWRVMVVRSTTGSSSVEY